jgi:hypothetical protein
MRKYTNLGMPKLIINVRDIQKRGEHMTKYFLNKSKSSAVVKNKSCVGATLATTLLLSAMVFASLAVAGATAPAQRNVAEDSNVLAAATLPLPLPYQAMVQSDPRLHNAADYFSFGKISITKNDAQGAITEAFAVTDFFTPVPHTVFRYSNNSWQEIPFPFVSNGTVADFGFLCDSWGPQNSASPHVIFVGETTDGVIHSVPTIFMYNKEGAGEWKKREFKIDGSDYSSFSAVNGTTGSDGKIKQVLSLGFTMKSGAEKHDIIAAKCSVKCESLDEGNWSLKTITTNVGFAKIDTWIAKDQQNNIKHVLFVRGNKIYNYNFATDQVELETTEPGTPTSLNSVWGTADKDGKIMLALVIGVEGVYQREVKGDVVKWTLMDPKFIDPENGLKNTRLMSVGGAVDANGNIKQIIVGGNYVDANGHYFPIAFEYDVVKKRWSKVSLPSITPLEFTLGIQTIQGAVTASGNGQMMMGGGLVVEKDVERQRVTFRKVAGKWIDEAVPAPWYSKGGKAKAN